MALLSDYQGQTQNLLNDTGAVIWSLAELTGYINTARNQIAGSSETVRALGSFTLAGGLQTFNLSGINVTPANAGALRPINVRSCAGPSFNVDVWPWDRFQLYVLGASPPPQGPPKVLAIYNPGVNGIVYLNPTPLVSTQFSLDCTCLPITLVNPTDVDAGIVYPWSDAIAYYAAYMAFLRVQRMVDARSMFEAYQVFERRAVQITGPTRLLDSSQPAGSQERAALRQPLTIVPSGGGTGSARGGR